MRVIYDISLMSYDHFGSKNLCSKSCSDPFPDPNGHFFRLILILMLLSYLRLSLLLYHTGILLHWRLWSWNLEKETGFSLCPKILFENLEILSLNFVSEECSIYPGFFHLICIRINFNQRYKNKSVRWQGKIC